MATGNRRECMMSLFGAGAAMTAGKVVAPQNAAAHPRPEKNAISLALWSLVQSFRAGVWKLTDVAQIVRKDFGLDGIEYVNQFFENPVEPYLRQLNKAARDNGVQNVLIMVDNEGDMVAKEKSVRMQAALNHRKWVEIAAVLGCHAIRCNARGGGNSMAEDPDALDRAAEAFGDLIEYAKPFKINILIENHGGLSSDPQWLPALCNKINSPHFGLLPDYGNYTVADEVARIEAVRKAMPFAKGVSVKAGWQSDHTHPGYSLEALLKVSMDCGYTGFWGIESGMRDAAGKAAAKGKMAAKTPTGSPDDVKKRDWQAVLWTKEVIEKVVFGKTRA